MECLPADRPRTGNRASAGIVSLLQKSAIFRDYHTAFETTTGLPLALREAGSFQAPLHDSNRLNPFCGLMAQRNNTCAACLQLQQQVEQEAVREPVTRECFAGMSETAVPIRNGENLVGYLRTGQVFLRAPTKRGFIKALGVRGGTLTADEFKELEAAYFRTRVVPKHSYDSMVRLLAIFAQHLACVSNQVLTAESTGETPIITKARAFINEHQSEKLRIHEVARAVNMSSFYFSKIFKKTTGLTFTNYLARRRVEVVKGLLVNVHIRVTEAAYGAGFQSLSQFNRVFHRVAGETPSIFRGRLHRAPPRRHASGL